MDLTPAEKKYEKQIEFAFQMLTDPDLGTPSARSLLKKFGGSLTTHNKAMQAFWAVLSRQLLTTEDFGPDFPPQVVEAMRTVVELSRSTAKSALRNRESELVLKEIKFKEDIDLLASQLQDAKSKSTKKDDEIERLNGEIIQANQANELITEEIVDLRGSYNIQGERLSSLQRELTRADDRTRALEFDLKETKIYGRESHEKALNIESQLIIAHERIKVLEDRLSREKNTTEEYKKSALKLSSDLAQMNGLTTRLNEQINEIRDRYEKRVDLLTDEAKNDREEHSKEIALLTKSKYLLQEQHDFLLLTLNEKDAENEQLRNQLQELKM